MKRKFSSIAIYIILVLVNIGCADNKTNDSKVDEAAVITNNIENTTKTLVFEEVTGGLYTYELEFTGEDVKITYTFDKYDPIIEKGKFIDGKIIVNDCDNCYVFDNNSLCVSNPETDGYDCFEFSTIKSTHRVEELNDNTKNKTEHVSDLIENKNEMQVYFTKYSLSGFESGKNGNKNLKGFIIIKSNQSVKACYFEYNGNDFTGDSFSDYVILASNSVQPLSDFKINGTTVSFSHRVVYLGETKNCPYTEFVSGELKDTLFATITVKNPCEEDSQKSGEWILAEMPNIDFERIPKLKAFINSNRSQNEPTNIESSPNTLNFKDIQMNLVDGSLKKAKIYLGEPDKIEYGFGHITKGFVIYYNRVTNPGGNPKNLVLFLRMNGKQWGNNASIEEMYSIEDNQKACFGIHCIKIKNQTIYTNALDLIYDRKYPSL